MTKKGSNCFLQLLDVNVSLILANAPWLPHPILRLPAEEGRSLFHPQAAATWGNLESLGLGQSEGTAWML